MADRDLPRYRIMASYVITLDRSGIRRWQSVRPDANELPLVCHKRTNSEQARRAENVDFLLTCHLFNQKSNVAPMSKPISSL